MQVHSGLPEEFLFAERSIDFKIKNEYWESWVAPETYYDNDDSNSALWVILILTGLCICCICGCVGYAKSKGNGND